MAHFCGKPQQAPRGEPLPSPSQRHKVADAGSFSTCCSVSRFKSDNASVADIEDKLAFVTTLLNEQHEALKMRLDKVLLCIGAPEMDKWPPAGYSRAEIVPDSGPYKSPSKVAVLASVDKVDSQASAETRPSLRQKGSKAAQTGAGHRRWFDFAVSILVLLNWFVTFVELEWRGSENAARLGIGPDDQNWHTAQRVFRLMELGFVAIFSMELPVRIFLQRLSFFRDPLNISDSFVILLAALESFVVSPAQDGGAASTKILGLTRALRVLRAVRLLRFVRLLRVMRVFASLRVMVRTLCTCMDSLMWSMAVVGFIIMSAAMLMVQLTSDIIADESRSTELRVWCYKYYGTMFRASYTMFEATFSGAWASRLSRPLMEEVSGFFALFWLIYIAVVNFAVMRVLSAVFLKQTMDVANVDHERTSLLKMKEKEKILGTLREVFRLGDQEADGYLRRWEFEEMLEDQQILGLFKGIGLDPPELAMLFDLLEEDDGAADLEEFLAVALKLKSGVRTVDMIQVLHEQMLIRRTLNVVRDALLAPSKAVRSQWQVKRDAAAARQTR